MSGHVELSSEKYFQAAREAEAEREQSAVELPQKKMTAEKLAKYSSGSVLVVLAGTAALWWSVHGDAAMKSATRTINPIDTVLWMKGSKETTNSLVAKMKNRQARQMAEVQSRIDSNMEDVMELSKAIQTRGR